jgi:hypothetical protein
MTDANTPRTLAELQRLAVPLDAVVVTRQAYEQLRTGLVAAPTPAEPWSWQGENTERLTSLPTPVAPRYAWHANGDLCGGEDCPVLDADGDHPEPTPAEPLAVDVLARALHEESNTIGCMGNYETCLSRNEHERIARAALAAARPDTPASAEQPGLREALERTLANFKALLARKPVRDATETIAEAEAALAASPSPEPEGGIMVARGVERYR